MGSEEEGGRNTLFYLETEVSLIQTKPLNNVKKNRSIKSFIKPVAVSAQQTVLNTDLKWKNTFYKLSFEVSVLK